jgi:hypothetical protein
MKDFFGVGVEYDNEVLVKETILKARLRGGGGENRIYKP